MRIILNAECAGLEIYVMQLRKYQSEAVDSFFQWFCDGKDKPLIVLPTGTGKSVVAAEICQRMLKQYPRTRILVATHVKELVQQNYDKMLAVWPGSPAGIISAGLNRKDFHTPIMFGGIQSMYRRAIDIGHVDLVLIDEAHCIPRRGMGMWNTLLADLKKINPKLCMGGMTATPFRMTTGTLTGGQDPQFNGVCYEYSIVQALKDGYLSEITTAPVRTHLLTDGVKKRGGEFIPSELQKAVNVDKLTKACCDEIISIGEDRKSWLVFASGNAHAQSIYEYLESKGLNGYLVTQETTKSLRQQAVQDLVDGRCRFLVNNMILTTGFDCPRLDLIACMRPTQSPGLWVQMCGRGTRLHPEKENCLLLDFGRNIDRHGPIDQISGSEWYEKEKGDAPIKNCPACYAVVHASVRACPDCGHEFPAGQLNITKKASTDALFSHQKSEPFETQVLGMRVSRHKGKDGKPDTMKVSYTTLAGGVIEWICYGHPPGSYAHMKACEWGGHFSSVDDALQHEWQTPKTITVKKNGKYYNVISRQF